MKHYQLTPVMRALGFSTTGVSFVHYQHEIVLERIKQGCTDGRNEFVWIISVGRYRLRYQGRYGAYNTAERAAKVAFKHLKIDIPVEAKRIWQARKNEIALRSKQERLRQKRVASSLPKSTKP